MTAGKAAAGFCLLSLWGSGCGNAAESHPEPLVVLAASSLKRPFEAIAVGLRRQESSPPVTFSFAGSQDLAAQIEAGAPADVFASASRKYMDRLVGKGLIDGGRVRQFATNWLAVASRKDLRPPLETLADLGRPGLRIVIADPKVPVGKVAADLLDWLEKGTSGLKARILANVVSFEQSDLALLAKVRLGEVDVALVYQSDLVDEPNLRRLDVPPESGCGQAYYVAPLRATKREFGARSFTDTLCMGPRAMQTLRDFGFGVSNGSSSSGSPSGAKG